VKWRPYGDKKKNEDEKKKKTTAGLPSDENHYWENSGPFVPSTVEFQGRRRVVDDGKLVSHSWSSSKDLELLLYCKKIN